MYPILKNHEKIFQARSHIIKFTFEKASRMEERLEMERLGKRKSVGRIPQYSRQERVRS